MVNSAKDSKNHLVENTMVFFLFIVILFFNSLRTLSEFFSYGIFKKEILTTKSKLGLDIKIIIK